MERLEPDPRRTQVGIFFLCLFCLFVCGAALHKIHSVAVQLHKQHLLLLLLCVARKEEEEGDGIAFFFFFFVQREKFQRIRAQSSELLLFVSLFFLLFLLALLRFF